MVKTKIENALCLLWKDKATIINYVSKTDSDGITSSFKEIIASNVPCKVSYSSDNTGLQTDTTDNISQTIKLFISNDIDVKPGSDITVKKANGRIEKYKSSGLVNSYTAHQEINLINVEGFA